MADAMRHIKEGATINEHFAARGGKYVDNTDAHAGNWIGIYAHESVVIDTMTAPSIEGTLENIPVPAGAFFQFGAGASSVTLTSGKATLLRG